MGSKAKTILIVDDSEFQVKALGNALRRNGYGVDLSSNGFHALELIEKSPYDLIIVDYHMPLMSGAELLLLIRHTQPKTDLPVIMISADVSSDIVKECNDYEANDFCLKQNDLNPLLKKISSLFVEKDSKKS